MIQRAVAIFTAAGLLMACGGDETGPSNCSVCSAGAAGDGGIGAGGSAGCEIGCGGMAGGAGVAGTAGTPEGCVDILVSKPTMMAPYIFVNAPLAGWLHVDTIGVHVACGAYVKAQRPTRNGRVWLSQISFDRADGRVLWEHFYDIFPSGIDDQSGGLYAVGWHDAQFVTADIHPPQAPATITFGTIGKPGIDDAVSVPLGPTGVSAPISHVGWDGEAYALHSFSPELYLARIAANGATPLPTTKYGDTSSPGFGAPVDHKTSTDPQSGTTYVFDANYDLWVSGHLRDGTPLPGTASGAKAIEAIGTETYPGHRPAVAAMSDGAWVSWRQSAPGQIGSTRIVQRLDANGDPTDNAIALPEAPDPYLTYEAAAIIPRSGHGFTIFTATKYRLYVHEFDGATLYAPRVILDGPTDVDATHVLDARDLIALEHDGETWFGFSENSEVLRVLKVAPGCTYARKVHLGPDAGHYH